MRIPRLLARYNPLFPDRSDRCPRAKPDRITQLLESAKTIAVVGLTDTPLRPSYGVSHYMQSEGYRIIPVNPNITAWMGEQAYRRCSILPTRLTS